MINLFAESDVSDHPKANIQADLQGDAVAHDIDLSADIAAIDAPGIVPDAGQPVPRPQQRGLISKLMIMAPSRSEQARAQDHRKQDFGRQDSGRQDSGRQDSGRQDAGNQDQHRHDWDNVRIDPVVAAAHVNNGGSGRKTSAIIAVAVVAGIAGALGTALATVGVSYFSNKPDPAIAANHSRALDESMTRIESDLAALRSNVDRVAKASASQAGKTADRLDRIEKAQADPAAKLAKLNDTVEKLRVAAATPAPAPVAPPAPAAAPPAPAVVASAPAKDVTGSVTPPKETPAPAPKPEIARLPIVEGWVVVDAGNGGATIESRRGVYDVIAGDPVPGLGRVDAIRRQDGRWVVVTSKGLIVAR